MQAVMMHDKKLSWQAAKSELHAEWQAGSAHTATTIVELASRQTLVDKLLATETGHRQQ